MALAAQHRFQEHLRELTVTSSLEALAAVWLFISGFLLHGGFGAVLINNVFLGGVLAPMAFGVFARWRVSWLSAAIGAWLIASPLMLGFTSNEAATWSNVITGAAIVVLSLVGGKSALEAQAINRSAPRP